ncbi:glycosyltransferase involved in cell wall biosynthesis [Spinactinospora alkalitolerans]|uniref:Glycosyltransferase involved in cell wall biosynthesis n=1 Tax=Spinactinospora alkalitolerans TaxID=687207 RepID=A0A852U1Y3_9ACTN|nr:glycosyltransferase family 4 protein [Spinactinospora alkalitolerans]NYE49545.1 glycosyltransferase involved in cell wall biosynthesis [Spinactinospora alkalitolerans]
MPPRAPAHRIGYVLKMYPRFSETFVVTEILAREARGADIEIFSLRLPTDGRFHENLALVRAPVTYVPHARVRAEELWGLLGRLNAALPVRGGALAELLAADADDAAQAMELALCVTANGITHLHAHFGSVATTVARLAALLTGVTYSFTAHAKDIFHSSVSHADLAAKLSCAHHVVTVSDYNAAHLARSHGSAASGVRRVYNGVHLPDFGYADPAERPPLIAAVGRLVQKKGFDVLVQACALLARRDVRFRCRIAGAGALAGDLADRIERLGLTGAVELAGPLTRARVRELVSGAAVLAAPCVVGSDGNTDGLPTVLLEAMALGTPCVSTDVTGVPEAVRDGETGVVVGQRDPAALADALAALLTDPARRVRLARAARALVEREFDAAAQARRLDALLPVPAPPLPAAGRGATAVVA